MSLIELKEAVGTKELERWYRVHGGQDKTLEDITSGSYFLLAKIVK